MKFSILAITAVLLTVSTLSLFDAVADPAPVADAPVKLSWLTDKNAAPVRLAVPSNLFMMADGCDANSVDCTARGSRSLLIHVNLSSFGSTADKLTKLEDAANVLMTSHYAEESSDALYQSFALAGMAEVLGDGKLANAPVEGASIFVLKRLVAPAEKRTKGMLATEYLYPGKSNSCSQYETPKSAHKYMSFVPAMCAEWLSSGVILRCLEENSALSAMPGFADCSEAYLLPELNALVEVKFRRKHLADWQSIKDRSTRLLMSFR